MKKFAIAIGMLVALSGCAGKQSWAEYAEEHKCSPTGATQLKTYVINNQIPMGSGGIGMGGGSVSVPTPKIQRIFEYQCNNGVIWAQN